MEKRRQLRLIAHQHGWLWVLFVLLCSSTSPQLLAESPPIRADVQPLAIRSRSNAPAYIDVKLQSRQQSILEGILELRVQAEGRPLFQLQTRELAVGPAGTTQRLLLPPGGVEQSAQLRFLGKKGTFDLGWFPLEVARSSGRQFLIAVCGSSSLAAGQLRVWQALRPEVVITESSNQDQIVRSSPVFLSSEDLPSAIGLCAFDLLVLEGPSFAALEEKQLAQIATWVQAGGSLCVSPSSPLDAAHLAFLNQLGEKKNQPAAVTPESDGKLTFRAPAHTLSRPGLGRMAIVARAPSNEEEMAAAEWKEVVSFLIRARSVRPLAVPPSPGYVTGPATLTQSTLFSLFPRTTRMVPASFVITLLGVFVIIVGPGEWLILGRLRKRRWTWITFPLFSITFAAIAVRAADHYLGRADRRAEAIVTDLGSQGRVLRQNRLEFRFAGRDTSFVMEIQQGLVTPCRIRNDGPLTEDRTPLYQGSLTGRYTMTQRLKQWQPQLQRTLYLGGNADVPKVDWDQVDASSFVKNDLNLLRPWVESFYAQGWSIQIINRTQVNMLDGVPFRHIAYRELVDALSQVRTTDPRSWAAAIAPTGYADLADLAVFDPSNSHEWLVVATKTSGQTLHIVRRLYTHE